VLPGGVVPVPLAAGSSPAATVVLSHTEQTRFIPAQPGVEVVVAGDPCLDQMTNSLPRRTRYRDAIGVAEAARIVLLTSTWGPASQIATLPDLSREVAEALPIDEWRVAMVIHPNVWHGHSTWQVRTWLRRSVDAGVLLVPPDHDEWQAMVIAADLVVADHGSVGLYAASIGKPVLTAAFGHDEVVAGVPLSELGRRAPVLDLDGALRPQLEHALAEHRPDAYADLAARVSGRPGLAATTIRDTIYRLVDLDVPSLPPPDHAVGVPDVAFADLDAHIVVATVVDADPSAPVVAIERHPVTSRTPLLPLVSDTSSCGSRPPRRSCSRAQRSSCAIGPGPAPRRRGRGRTARCSSIRGAATPSRPTSMRRWPCIDGAPNPSASPWPLEARSIRGRGLLWSTPSS
jgi:hypothetical protein